MRRIVFLLLMFMSFEALADIQQRIYFFTKQSEIFHRICFNERGEFTNVKFWDAQSPDTAFDCHDQAIALNEESEAIEREMAALGGDRCTLDITNPELNSLLTGGSDVAGQLTCPGAGSAENCLGNISCNIVQTMLPAGGALTRLVERTSGVDLGCSQNDGGMNCGSALANGILDSLWDNVTSLCWMVTFGNFCNGESKVDPESRTEVAAAAAASQDDGAIAQFRNDPIGFMKKVVNAIIESITNTVKTRYACQEWAGMPGLSACKTPIDELSWECQDCSQRMNMICGVGGYIGAEVISLFFTGGVSGGAKAVGELLQQSSHAMKIAKLVSESRIGKVAIEGIRLGSRLGQWAGQKLGAVWAGIKSLPPMTAIKDVSRQLRIGAGALNAAAREVRVYALTQDGLAALARQFNQIAKAGHDLGYNATYRVFGRTRNEVVAGWPAYVNDAQAGLVLAEYRRLHPDIAPTLSIRKVDVPNEAGGYRQIVVIVNERGTPITDTIRLEPHVGRPSPQSAPEMPEGIVMTTPPRTVGITLSTEAQTTVAASRSRILEAPLPPAGNIYYGRASAAIRDVGDIELQDGLRTALAAMHDREMVANYVKTLQEDTFKAMILTGNADLIQKARLGQLDRNIMEIVLRQRARSHGAGISIIPADAKQLGDDAFRAKLAGGYLIDLPFSGADHGSFMHFVQQDFTYDIIARKSGKTHQEIIQFFGTPEGLRVWSNMYDAVDGVPGNLIGPVQVEEWRRIYMRDLPLN